MKRYLLKKEGNFYKANLHCHSTVSDGALTPEQIKEEYKKRGYSIVAYTDHDVLVSQRHLKDESFLPLNAYEIEVTQGHEQERAIIGMESVDKKTCHICLIAIDENNLKQVCFHRSAYTVGNGSKYLDKVQFDDKEPNFIRKYTPECINEIIKRAKEGGFFVTYNHPVWSHEEYSDYMNYHGMHAMEICNYSCMKAGYEEYNPDIYDKMLRSGKRLYCLSTDDNHNKFPPHSNSTDSFGGFTMIKAEKLEYSAITKALLNGDFYASQGPLIEELYLEDDKVTIKCSPAKSITLSVGTRRNKITHAEGELLTQATFPVSKDLKYFRLTVTDKEGNHANTNAYFTDQVL